MRIILTFALFLSVSLAQAHAAMECYVTASPPSLNDKDHYPCTLDNQGNLRVVGNFGTITVSGANGAITDGVTPSILATVRNYTNGKPLTVEIVDTSGNPASGLALDATLTGGTQKAIMRGGAKGSTTVTDVTSTASGSNHQPLDVVIYDTSGNAITSFGGSGGTSSSFGSAFPTPGTAAGFTDGTNMVAGRVVTSTPGSGDAGLVVRNISPASSTIGSAVPSVGVQVTGSDGTNARALATDTSGTVQANVKQINGVAPSMGNGVSGTGVQRVTLASDSTGTVAVTQATGTNLHIVCDSGCSSSSGFADNGAFTFGTTAINPIGGVLDDTSTNTATENSAAIARITPQKGLHVNLRNQSGTEIGTSGTPVRIDPTGTTTQPVSGNVGIVPITNGGTTPCYLTSAASTNATNCKASAAQLYGFDLVNTTTTIYYLRIYNLSTSPTCSSATGFVRTIPVPPAAAAGGAGGITRSIPVGEAYGTGIGFCLTGGGSSTDNTNAATGVYVTLNYK